MRRAIQVFLIVTLAMATAIRFPASASAADSSSAWRAIAEQAMTLHDQPETVKPDLPAFLKGARLMAIGEMYGYTDPRVQPLIDELMAMRNADGGWGTGIAKDWFNDGTVNSNTVSYTVTTAGHVGIPLLRAYLGGADVSPDVIHGIVYFLTTLPRINTAEGTCVAYSKSANDAKPGYCVHNVNAGVAAFLNEAAAAGFSRKGSARLIVSITQREVAAYNETISGWTYSDASSGIQDRDHGAYSAQSMADLAWPVGREAAYMIMVTAGTDDNLKRGHMRIPSFPAGPGTNSATHKTLWCELGDKYLAEATAYVTSKAGDRTSLMQAAGFAIANAKAC